ncbi:MAG: DUF1232 domain-containing protein [Deferribacteraceae bacterium]|jgi:uncharacterized membrane protein YkvA (DUF1232 family)|nr:DUF1232 domain-containing protein [Deferribacteraceae bacterium]
MNLKERAKQVKRDIPAVFIALRRKDTPAIAKILAAITVVYALSPIDLIPDFIPVLGLLDDLIILPILITLTVKLIPDTIFEACRAESQEIWRTGKPKRWYYAIPILLAWLVICLLVIKIY